MKIVQSYWSRPANGQAVEGGRRTGGWASQRYQCLGMALSCLLLRRFYDQVELVTDELGKALLIDALGLPYTSVRVCLNALDHYPHSLWALPKLYAYGLQQEPFIHVDSDFFAWAPFGAAIEQAPLIAQSPEQDGNGVYARSLAKLARTLPRLSPLVTECHALPDGPLAVNAGILGGNDLAFIQEYVRSAFALVDDNLDALRQDEQAGRHNIILEQYLFHQLALVQGKPIAYAIPKLGHDFIELLKLDQVPNIVSYVHLIGGAKAFSINCEQIEHRLRYEFPQEYRRLCRSIGQLGPGSSEPPPGPKPVAEAAYPLLSQFLQPHGIEASQYDERALRRLVHRLTKPLPHPAAIFIREVFEVERIIQQMMRRRRTFAGRRRRYLKQAYVFLAGQDATSIMAASFTCTDDVHIVPTHWPADQFKAATLPDLAQLTLPEPVRYLLIGNSNSDLYLQDLMGIDRALAFFQGVACSGTEVMEHFLSETSTALEREQMQAYLLDFLTYQMVYAGRLQPLTAT